MITRKFHFTVLMMVLALMAAGCGEGGGGSGSSKEKPPPVRAASPLVLEATSLEYGAELTWNQEAFPDATFNLCIVEEELATNSEGCFFDAESTISNEHTAPLTLTGCSGGRRYWMQLEAVMPSGAALYSWPVMVTTSVADTELLGTDDYDWRNDPDLTAEKQAIARQVSGFKQALNDKDPQAAAAVIAEDQRDVYQALFNHNLAAMPAFGALLDSARMSFLSPPVDPTADSTVRTAEYELEIDGFTFYVRWMKSGDTWLLMDF